MTKKVNIIGAGLAGLSTGIFLQKAGIATEIFELSARTGGMCAAWERKGFRFDGCIRWMEGTNQDDPAYQLYKEVGALSEDSVVYHPETVEIEVDGQYYKIPMELSKFQSFMNELSDGDRQKIGMLCADIGTLIELRKADGLSLGLATRFKDGQKARQLQKKYCNQKVGAYTELFQSEAVRKILLALLPRGYSATALLSVLAARMSGNAGYPLGGALELIRRMEETYLASGGQIRLGTRVREIAVKGSKTIGVTACDEFFPSDGVVAACAAYDTLQKLLQSKYSQPQLALLLKSGVYHEPFAIASFGLNKQFGMPYLAHYDCPKGFEVAPGIRSHSCSVRSFEFDPAAAPNGCSSVMASFLAPLEYWTALRNESPKDYRLRKELLAETAACEIEKRYPGFKDAITVVDIATPATYARLTNVYRGSVEMLSPSSSLLKTPIGKTIHGLKNFCLCGQWTTAGGGIKRAVEDGKLAASIMKDRL